MVLWSGRALWSAASLYAVGIAAARYTSQSGHLLAPQSLSKRAIRDNPALICPVAAFASRGATRIYFAKALSPGAPPKNR